MATLSYGLQQSLDGYVDHMKLGPPGPAVFRHYIERLGTLAGCLYGRRTYEIMRYWDEDQPDWDAPEREFAALWRTRRKWVASHTDAPVGPNASLIGQDIATAVRALKADLVGEIEVAGPELAGYLTGLGLIDTYRLNFRPLVLGGGTPFFAGPTPQLRLVASHILGDDMVSLTYALA
jgi:dihydrofolate reductase